LIAPFAFLGPQYDDVIRIVATSIGPKDVFHARNRLAGLASDGMADSGPLQRLVTKCITPEILAAIAREYRKGARTSPVGTLRRNLNAAWHSPSRYLHFQNEPPVGHHPRRVY
jgi:hypothetical protein